MSGSGDEITRLEVEIVDEADEAARRFRERAVAILEVALRIGGAAATGAV